MDTAPHHRLLTAKLGHRNRNGGALMGGKPNPGTKKDKRLKENKKRKKKR